MHSRNCSFVILGLTFFFTILSTIRLFSVKWSVATLFPEVPILVPTLVVLLVLIVRSLAPLLVAPLVASLVPILVALLSRQIEVMNSALKSISEFFSHYHLCLNTAAILLVRLFMLKKVENGLRVPEARYPNNPTSA